MSLEGVEDSSRVRRPTQPGSAGQGEYLTTAAVIYGESIRRLLRLPIYVDPKQLPDGPSAFRIYTPEGTLLVHWWYSIGVVKSRPLILGHGFLESHRSVTS